jgi:hypothetical protein
MRRPSPVLCGVPRTRAPILSHILAPETFACLKAAAGEDHSLRAQLSSRSVSCADRNAGHPAVFGEETLCGATVLVFAAHVQERVALCCEKADTFVLRRQR